MHVFIIPFWVAVCLAILAWIGVAYIYWFKPKVMPKLDDFFAQRRHNRRVRNYVRRDTALALNTMQKGSAYATARRRR